VHLGRFHVNPEGDCPLWTCPLWTVRPHTIVLRSQAWQVMIRLVSRPPVEIIRKALAEHHTVPAAAQALGVGERTLFRWLARDPSLARAGVDRAARGNNACDNVTRSAVVAAVVRGATVAGAAREAGVSRTTAARWVREARAV
jgi:transposase-like protein